VCFNVILLSFRSLCQFYGFIDNNDIEKVCYIVRQCVMCCFYFLRRVLGVYVYSNVGWHLTHQIAAGGLFFVCSFLIAVEFSIAPNPFRAQYLLIIYQGGYRVS
jgi:hypothetical protein